MVGTHFLGPVYSENGFVVTATGTSAARSVEDRFAEIPNVEDWRGAGGDPSDNGAIQAAITAIKADGGAELRFLPQLYSLEETIDIDCNHVRLVGQGSGYPRVGGASQIPLAARTRLLWNGDVGGTMVHFHAPAGGRRGVGGGIRGIQIEGNTFRAARGVVIGSWVQGVFHDVLVYTCSESHWRTYVVDYALATSEPGDTQRCLFELCWATTIGDNTATYFDATGIGWHLTGGSSFHSGNTSGNIFLQCNARMSKGLPWKLENTDDNVFYFINGDAVYDDTVYGIELGSEDQDSIGTSPLGPGPARYNMFYGTGGTIHARSSQTGLVSSHDNNLLGYSRASGIAPVTIEPPAGGALAATIFYWDLLGNTRQKAAGLVEGAAEPSPTDVPGTSQLYVDAVAGPLKVMSSAGRPKDIITAKIAPDIDQSPVIYSRFNDGIGTPGIVVGTPTVRFTEDFSAGLGTWTTVGTAPTIVAAPWGSGQAIKCDTAAATPNAYLTRSISLDKGRIIEFDLWLPTITVTPTAAPARVYVCHLRSSAGYYLFALKLGAENDITFQTTYYETPNATPHTFDTERLFAANTKYRIKLEMYQGSDASQQGRILLSIDGVVANEAPWAANDFGQTSVAALHFGLTTSNIGVPFSAYLGNLTVSDMTTGSLATRFTGSAAGIDFVGGWATAASGYATGTWTPVFAFATPGDSVITHTVQSGKYLKFGGFVFLMLDIEFSTNAYTTASGVGQITGLPFAPHSSGPEGSLTASFVSNVTFTGSTQDLRWSIPTNANAIYTRILTSNAAATNGGTTVYPASKTDIRIKASGMYWTNL